MEGCWTSFLRGGVVIWVTDSDEVCGNVLVNGKFRDKTKKQILYLARGNVDLKKNVVV